MSDAAASTDWRVYAAKVKELTARLASAEGEQEYWKKACAIEKAQHDQTIATNKAAVEQARHNGVEFALARLSDEAAYLGIADTKVDTIVEKIRQRAALTQAAGGPADDGCRCRETCWTPEPCPVHGFKGPANG